MNLQKLKSIISGGVNVDLVLGNKRLVNFEDLEVGILQNETEKKMGGGVSHVGHLQAA